MRSTNKPTIENETKLIEQIEADAKARLSGKYWKDRMATLEYIRDFVITMPGSNFVKTVRPTKRGLALSSFSCPRSGDKKFCKWCHEHEAVGRRFYCSEHCKESALIYCFPQNYFSKKYHLAKQGMKCAICDHVHASWFWANFEYARDNDLGEPDRGYCLTTGELVKTPHLDHIKPIHQGGRSIGLENVQVICESCHYKKSAKERTEYARSRK